jgi:5-hydroxyisourate hydrolase-like protein (transthyretin family)
MNQRLYLLLLIICLSIPLAVDAQVAELVIISGDNQIGRTGQTLQPFVVEAQNQNGDPVSGVIVTFAPDRGSVSDLLVLTGADGRASSTLTLSRRAGTATITVSAEDASVTFTATAIVPTRTTTSTTSTPSPPPVPDPDPTVFFRISGDNQRGVVGEPLAKPFVVGTRDRGGDPLEDLRIVFKVVTGGGSLSAEIAWTDATGRAANTLTLGPKPGTNTVEVRAHGTDRVIVFRAEATLPPTPTALSIISGENQTGLTGEALAAPFVVEIRDQYSNPMGGVTVTFAVTAGDGSLSTTAATTDTNGRAESTLTPGSNPGTNTVSASIEGISQTVAFNAEATLPPPIPTALSIISGENQTGLTGEVLGRPFIVEVRDQYGDPIEGVTVTFTVRTGIGALLDTTVMTDENGRAETTLTLGNDPGGYTVDVSVEGIAKTETFIALAELLGFDLLLPAGLSLIHIPLKVRAVNEMPGTIGSVADLYDALGGTDTVNWLSTHDVPTQTWHIYFGDADRGSIADRALTEGAGVLVSVKTPIAVHLTGDPLDTDGASAITLNPGLNLVGIPLRDPRVTRVSDLLTLEGLGDSITAIVVTDNGEVKVVGRAGDEGDIPVTGGQGFGLIVQQLVTVPITGKAWGE